MKSIKTFTLLLLIICNCKHLDAQLTGLELFEIIDLYTEGQYDVVSAKLRNASLELKESTPDYTSNQIDYKGDFMLVQTTRCQTGYIQFKTYENSSRRTIQIEFNLVIPNAINFFDFKCDQLRKELGGGKISKDDIGRKVAEFRDTAEYYGKIPEDLSKLAIFNNKSIYFLKCYKAEPDILCTLGYSSLEGQILYEIPKYPVHNYSEYFENLELNKKKIAVPVKKQNNTYVIQISIAGQNFNYILDSGASEMVISRDMENQFRETGIIRDGDYLPSKSFILADGSERIYRRVIIPLIRIGTIKVVDIEAAISETSGPLLLGKSFLDKFKYWKINNENLTLELQYQ